MRRGQRIYIKVIVGSGEQVLLLVAHPHHQDIYFDNIVETRKLWSNSKINCFQNFASKCQPLYHPSFTYQCASLIFYPYQSPFNHSMPPNGKHAAKMGEILMKSLTDVHAIIGINIRRWRKLNQFMLISFINSVTLHPFSMLETKGKRLGI